MMNLIRYPVCLDVCLSISKSRSHVIVFLMMPFSNPLYRVSSQWLRPVKGIIVLFWGNNKHHQKTHIFRMAIHLASALSAIKPPMTGSVMSWSRATLIMSLWVVLRDNASSPLNSDTCENCAQWSIVVMINVGTECWSIRCYAVHYIRAHRQTLKLPPTFTWQRMSTPKPCPLVLILKTCGLPFLLPWPGNR